MIEIQVRLMRIKAMPVIRLRHRIPRPVRSLEIFKNDPRVLVALRRITPDIEVRVLVVASVVAGGVDPGPAVFSRIAGVTAPGHSGAARGDRAARFLEPRILIRG